ncbi:MAG: glycerol kinase, partial [Planctomycetaceae bacterium]|nr:glycerol kinase [Planctomycetaceae bacterium]
LAIDQGTTSSRAMVFDQNGVPISVGQSEFPQIFPHDGWVEHNPEDIWQTISEGIVSTVLSWLNRAAVTLQFRKITY